MFTLICSCLSSAVVSGFQYAMRLTQRLASLLRPAKPVAAVLGRAALYIGVRAVILSSHVLVAAAIFVLWWAAAALYKSAPYMLAATYWAVQAGVHVLSRLVSLLSCCVSFSFRHVLSLRPVVRV